MSELIVINQRHLDFLERNRIFLNGAGDFKNAWLKVGQQYKITKSIVEPYSASYCGPTLSSTGAFTYTKSVFHPSIRIGRYCAIAAKVTLMPADHPMDRLSTCGFDYSNAPIFSSFENDSGVAFVKTLVKQKPSLPIIENDVWIAHEVFIKRGVRIGTGSIIGARSIVTKDVPPYAIVAGSPATVKRYRFDENIIEKLLISKWWDYAFTDFRGLNTLNPNEFLKQLEELVQTEKIKRFCPQPINLGEKFIELAE
jgi:virginiamycin A acetyltransferase